MRRNYKHDIYKKISHAERINILYLLHVHHLNMKKISDQIDVNYNSIRNIVETYRKTGRTNKKCFRSVYQ